MPQPFGFKNFDEGRHRTVLQVHLQSRPSVLIPDLCAVHINVWWPVFDT